MATRLRVAMKGWHGDTAVGVAMKRQKKHSSAKADR